MQREGRSDDGVNQLWLGGLIEPASEHSFSKHKVEGAEDITWREKGGRIRSKANCRLVPGHARIFVFLSIRKRQVEMRIVIVESSDMLFMKCFAREKHKYNKWQDDIRGQWEFYTHKWVLVKTRVSLSLWHAIKLPVRSHCNGLRVGKLNPSPSRYNVCPRDWVRTMLYTYMANQPALRTSPFFLGTPWKSTHRPGRSWAWVMCSSSAVVKGRGKAGDVQAESARPPDIQSLITRAGWIRVTMKFFHHVLSSCDPLFPAIFLLFKALPLYRWSFSRVVT